MDELQIKQLTENHTAIAEFMEFKKEKNNRYTVKMGVVFTVCSANAMKFSTSWDWLMPVVKKMYRKPYCSDAMPQLRIELGRADIREAYKTIVTTLDWCKKRNKL